DGVGDRRVDRATGLVGRPEHEVVDEQLGSPVEQLDERLFPGLRFEAVLLLDGHPGQLASLPRELVTQPGVLLLADEQLLVRGEPFFAGSNSAISHVLRPSSAHAATGSAATSAAFWRSSALAAPVRQLSDIVSDSGSGKISSSPRSIPSKMPRATDSGELFGISSPRTMSVSIGPAMTACTFTRPAKMARSDCESENAAAFEIE